MTHFAPEKNISADFLRDEFKETCVGQNDSLIEPSPAPLGFAAMLSSPAERERRNWSVATIDGEGPTRAQGCFDVLDFLALKGNLSSS